MVSITLTIDNNILKAYDVYNFPNPFKESTNFTFRISSYPSTAKISIFNLSGKRIKIIDNYECESSFCSIKWNGKDSNFRSINNGTYLYQLELINNEGIFQNLYKITKLK